MNRKQIGLVAAVSTVAAALAFTTLTASADTETPTREQAQAALAHIDEDQAIVKAYLDSLTTTPPTTTPAPPSTTKNPAPTTAPPTTDPPATTMDPPTTSPVSPRLSGMPWSSGVWARESRTLTPRFITEVRGGRQADNFLVYTQRASMAAQQNPTQWRNSLPAVFDPVKQDIVLSLTTWTADGAFMTNAQGRTFGTALCGIDATPHIRPDWEMNLPDGAGANGAVLTAANYTAWVARFRAVVTGIKATCPATKVTFNPNHGGDQTAGCNTSPASSQCSRRAFQAVKDLVDIFGIDRYDSWSPVTASGSGWGSHLNGHNELNESRTYALANGKKWSVPEWGLWTGANGGGDDPEYIRRYIAYFAANAGDLAYETYFNEPASYIISDLIDSNPNSRAAYRSAILAQ